MVVDPRINMCSLGYFYYDALALALAMLVGRGKPNTMIYSSGKTQKHYSLAMTKMRTRERERMWGWWWWWLEV